MLTAIIVLALFGTIVLTWANMREAAEVAIWHGRRACEDAGVQWLDHTVMLESLRLRRAADGWIRPLRRYRFDFSTDGHDRHRGQLELLGAQLQWLRLPTPAPAAPASSSENAWEVRMQVSGPPHDRGDGVT